MVFPRPGLNLLKKYIYLPSNKWNRDVNTGTIAHLIQRYNALSAEVDIAAQATILRQDLSYGKLITNINQLCGDGSSYGNAKRNSDPTVCIRTRHCNTKIVFCNQRYNL